MVQLGTFKLPQGHGLIILKNGSIIDVLIRLGKIGKDARMICGKVSAIKDKEYGAEIIYKLKSIKEIAPVSGDEVKVNFHQLNQGN